MIARSPMIFASATLALLAACVGVGLGGRMFGESLADDRRFVIEAFIERLSDQTPGISKNMVNILWRPSSSYFYAEYVDPSFPMGGEASKAFRTGLTRLQNDLLISAGHGRRSNLEWYTSFAKEGEALEPRHEKILGLLDEGSLSANLMSFLDEIGVSLHNYYYFETLYVRLVNPRPENSDVSKLDIECRPVLIYGSGSIGSTAMFFGGVIYSDDFLFWLKDQESQPDLVTLAVNHCFLMAMGLPAPSSPDQLWPMLQAARAAFACARRKDVFRGEEDLDHIDQLVERLRAICADDSPAR